LDDYILKIEFNTLGTQMRFGICIFENRTNPQTWSTISIT